MILLTILLLIMLVSSAVIGIPVIVPLIVGLGMFSVYAFFKGSTVREILTMLLFGAKKTQPVILVFIIVGMLIGVWMCSGTVAWFVYYGLQWITPNLFVFFCFLLSSFVSLALGTSFGTAGTIGMVLVIIARAGNVAIAPVIGAILSGAYVGDRNSPMSSSALLVATLTKTDFYGNISRMFRSGLPAFLITSVAYLAISPFFALSAVDTSFAEQLPTYFVISALNLIPIVVLILFILFKIRVKWAMLVSTASAAVIALFVQKSSWLSLLQSATVGFSLGGSGIVPSVMKGGGMVFMFNAILVVLISSAFSGLFEKGNLIRNYERWVERLSDKIGGYPASVITGLLTSALGCTQALAIILNTYLLQKPYKKLQLSKESFALDVEDSVVVLAALVPWNVAGAIPIKMLGGTIAALPFAFFLFLLPLTRLLKTTKKSHQNL